MLQYERYSSHIKTSRQPPNLFRAICGINPKKIFTTLLLERMEKYESPKIPISQLATTERIENHKRNFSLLQIVIHIRHSRINHNFMLPYTHSFHLYCSILCTMAVAIFTEIRIHMSLVSYKAVSEMHMSSDAGKFHTHKRHEGWESRFACKCHSNRYFRKIQTKLLLLWFLSLVGI